MIKDLARSGVDAKSAFREIAEAYPERWIQSAKGIKDLFYQLAPAEVFADEADLVLWDWQKEVASYIISDECLNNDRELVYVIDKRGGGGKTRLSRWLTHHYNGKISFFTPCAKSDDLACGMQEDSKCCIFDIPYNVAHDQLRVCQEFGEKVRGRRIFSGKYNSHTVMLPKMPVAYFSNVDPIQMSRGRMLIAELIWPTVLQPGAGKSQEPDPSKIKVKWYRDGELQRQSFTPVTKPDLAGGSGDGFCESCEECLKGSHHMFERYGAGYRAKGGCCQTGPEPDFSAPPYLSQHRLPEGGWVLEGGTDTELEDTPALVRVALSEEERREARLMDALRASGARVFPGKRERSG